MIVHDIRYRIHAFGLAHGQLFIFAASTFFAVPIGHPPFNASYGLTFSDLSNELTNNLYRTYRINNYNYATLVVELDEDWELFMIASNLQDIHTCCSKIWHTQQVIRNRQHKDMYEAPPGVFAWGFNGFFGDGALIAEGQTASAPFNMDRIINGDRFFFHVQQTNYSSDHICRYTITRYEQPPKASKAGFSLTVTEYIIQPVTECDFSNTTTSWYLTRKDTLEPSVIENLVDIDWLEARFPIVMLKNGYIYEDMMYLSKLDYLEVYELTYPKGRVEGQVIDQIKVTWKKNIASEDFVYCNLQDKDNKQYTATVQIGVGFILGTLLLAMMIFVNKVNSSAGHKYLNHEGSLVRLTDEMIYQNKKKK